MRGIHRWPVDSPHKGPVTRKMFPFDDVIMSKRGRSGGRTYHTGHVEGSSAVSGSVPLAPGTSEFICSFIKYLRYDIRVNFTTNTHVIYRIRRDYEHATRRYQAKVKLGWIINKLENLVIVMTSSNGNIFRVSGPLWGEYTCHRWIPHTKASDAELWWFLRYAPEQTVEQTTETLVISDAIALIMTSL